MYGLKKKYKLDSLHSNYGTTNLFATYLSVHDFLCPKNQFSFAWKPQKQLYCAYLYISSIPVIKTDFWSQHQTLGAFRQFYFSNSVGAEFRHEGEHLNFCQQA